MVKTAKKLGKPKPKRPTLEGVLERESEPNKINQALHDLLTRFDVKISQYDGLKVSPKVTKQEELQDIANILAGSLGCKGNPRLIIEVGIAHKATDENECSIRVVQHGKTVKSWKYSADMLDGFAKWVYRDINFDLSLYDGLQVDA